MSSVDSLEGSLKLISLLDVKLTEKNCERGERRCKGLRIDGVKFQYLLSYELLNNLLRIKFLYKGINFSKESENSSYTKRMIRRCKKFLKANNLKNLEHSGK